MKKIKFVYLFSFLSLMACDKEQQAVLDESGIKKEELGFTEGEIFSRSFKVNDEVVAEIDDSLVNFGTKEVPAIFPITKEVRTTHENYRSIFHELTKEKLMAFIVIWAKAFNIEDETLERKFIHFLNYLNTYYLDGSLLCDLVTNNPTEMTAVKKIIDSSEAVTKGSTSNININKLLYFAYRNNTSLTQMVANVENTGVSFETYLNSLANNTPLVDAQTKSADSIVKAIIKGVREVADFWIQFAKDHGPVVDFKNDTINILNDADINPLNYISYSYDETDTYTLSYKFAAWHATTKYYIKCFYNATNHSIPGKYITSLMVNCLEASAGGPMFVVNGGTGYSTPINTGTFEEPIANIQGNVEVEYGDCCCYHYFSYLNFTVWGDRGITIDSFTDHIKK